MSDEFQTLIGVRLDELTNGKMSITKTMQEIVPSQSISDLKEDPEEVVEEVIEEEVA